MATTEFNDMLVDNADFLKPFAVNLTKDSEAANDLYQETLYKALANHEKYNAGTNIKAWLFTIMVGSSRVDLQACKLEYSIVSPK